MATQPGGAEFRLAMIIVASACVLFACAATRYVLFCSDGDLAVFAQGTYLISRGEQPISSIKGFHILGDHVALVLYPLAALYALWTTPLCLLLVQSVALAIGAWPMWKLARHAGIGEENALVMAAAYLLYPVLFNANLADFHPEVIATPAILGTVLAARCHRFFLFCVGVLLILACKESLGLTIFAMGVWLFFCENRRSYGALAAFVGSIWVAVAFTVVIPAITGGDAALVTANNRYAYLGGSLSEIVKNLATRPGLPLNQLLSVSGLLYLINLASPLIWGLSPRHLAPLIGAIPQLGLNLLSQWNQQRHLTTPYSLPIFPFLLVAVLAAVAAEDTWVRSRRIILACCTLGFLVFARYPRVVGYFQNLGQWQASRTALQHIAPGAGVLTDDCFASHVTDRRGVYFLGQPFNADSLPNDAHYVLLNEWNPCGMTVVQAQETVRNLKGDRTLHVLFERDGVVLFGR